MAAFSDTAFDDVNAFSTDAFSFATVPAPTLPNPPGRVFKGKYPYWQDRRQPYWESDQQRAEPAEEEEMLAMMGIEL